MGDIFFEQVVDLDTPPLIVSLQLNENEGQQFSKTCVAENQRILESQLTAIEVRTL